MIQHRPIPSRTRRCLLADEAGERTGSSQCSACPAGVIADVWLISYADGSRIVGKTLSGAPGDLFAIEAEGLAALRATGQLGTLQVLGVTADFDAAEAPCRPGRTARRRGRGSPGTWPPRTAVRCMTGSAGIATGTWDGCARSTPQRP